MKKRPQPGAGGEGRRRRPEHHGVSSACAPAARAAILASFLLLLLSSCSFDYRVDCDPADASLRAEGLEIGNGQTFSSAKRDLVVEARRRGYLSYRGTLRHRGLFGLETLSLSLEPESYEIGISLTEEKAELAIDGVPMGRTPFKGKLNFGRHRLAFGSPRYPDQGFDLEVEGPADYLFRLQAKPDPDLRPLGIFRCGPAPKQVHFSPDGKRLFVPLLSGTGFDLIDLGERSATRIEVPGYGASTGFVEGLFIESKGSFLFSQMTRDAMHEFKLGGARPEYGRSLPTRGTWSKVLAYEPRADLIAVSNWVSGDVTILEYAEGALRKRLAGLGTPRGLAFSPEGSSLAIADFGKGRIFRYETAGWTRTGLIERAGGAPRHLVGTRDGRRLYASDMSRNEALEIDAAGFTVLHVYETEDNPNTIDLDSGEGILAVSCRGPNNPESYIKRSPERGSVLLFDTAARRLAARIEGGTQPTGLDISPDGRLLAFTNFQDATVELYDISGLAGRLETR